MANSKRRENFTDKNGNMMIPVNVEGGNYNEHFITTTKLVVMAILAIVLFYIVYKLNVSHSKLPTIILWLSIYLYASSFAVRYIIFEERFYYKMYKDLQKYKVSTPSLFWDIASIKDTDEGAILAYSDAKIAIVVKVDRDTITGKPKDFKETHYDAISDFYKDVVTQKYCFVQMNIMEQAGKDPRLNELSKVVYKSDNKNIIKLMEMEVGHIKNITHASLYESDYFLFYTTDITKVDSIIGDITESLFKLLDGAYVGYQILNSKDIVALIKEEFGVTYFNSTEASLLMYSNNDNSLIKPFDISGLIWTDGEKQTLSVSEKNKLRNITSKVIAETLKISDMSLKKALYRKEIKNKIGVDFESLSQTTYDKRRRTSANIDKQDQNKVDLSKTKEAEANSSNNIDTDDEYIDI